MYQYEKFASKNESVITAWPLTQEKGNNCQNFQHADMKDDIQESSDRKISNKVVLR